MTILSKTALSRRGVLAAGAAWASGSTQTLAEAGAMLTRPIPRSGERLPVIGLGTGMGFDVGADPAARAQRAAVVRLLIAGGGTIIDTAPSYGRAEALMGDVVAEADLRRSVFLATKLETYDHRTGEAELRGSLQRLRTNKIDLMQLHNLTDPNQDLSMLREWKARGVCRYTGITTTSHGDFPAIEAVLKREKPDFLEIGYSIEDREVEKRMIPLARDLGVALLIAIPFGGGPALRAARAKPLPDWAAAFGAASWAQFFLKYLLGEPVVTGVIPGTSNPAHMTDNLAAGRGRVPDAAERRRMVGYLAAL